ncbi:hypothetical protein F511_24352 [Dorcoceras hygrometricum]|uniref:Uncharacterized protein n=1 Tax=Dorcoceras hygrometricum TaxID=472368 RepID=A0A2Z7DAN3_9LAMI|nr:hypothetical protein F511_24352 [Dorcoceras hygrometricum]
MEELLERSPTLPRTYQTTAGDDGNCRRKATVNSNLGFKAKNTIGENILSMGSDISNRRPSLSVPNNGGRRWELPEKSYGEQ